MSGFIKVGKTSEFADGTMKKVLVQGNEILVARVKGKYYAADSLCPHLRGDLSRGTLEGTVVTCPLQGSQFDLRDGRVIRWLKESAPFFSARENAQATQTAQDL